MGCKLFAGGGRHGSSLAKRRAVRGALEEEMERSFGDHLIQLQRPDTVNLKKIHTVRVVSFQAQVRSALMLCAAELEALLAQ